MTRRHVLPTLAALGLCLTVVLADGTRQAGTPLAGNTNPAVAPGKVKWHPTFEAAREASAKSGKPVLLFQMLGKLDQEFC